VTAPITALIATKWLNTTVSVSRTATQAVSASR